jgi:hypothetical protein
LSVRAMAEWHVWLGVPGNRGARGVLARRQQCGDNSGIVGVWASAPCADSRIGGLGKGYIIDVRAAQEGWGIYLYLIAFRHDIDRVRWRRLLEMSTGAAHVGWATAAAADKQHGGSCD